MFERLLAISLGVVGLGVLYGCLRLAVTATVLGVRSTALVWRLARCRQLCPDCRRLGERCPWCGDDRYRVVATTLAVLLPVAGWPMMLRGPVEFPAGAKWAAGLWAAVWVLSLLARWA